MTEGRRATHLLASSLVQGCPTWSPPTKLSGSNPGISRFWLSPLPFLSCSCPRGQDNTAHSARGAHSVASELSWGLPMQAMQRKGHCHVYTWCSGHLHCATHMVSGMCERAGYPHGQWSKEERGKGPGALACPDVALLRMWPMLVQPWLLTSWMAFAWWLGCLHRDWEAHLSLAVAGFGPCSFAAFCLLKNPRGRKQQQQPCLQTHIYPKNSALCAGGLSQSPGQYHTIITTISYGHH